MNSKAWAHIPEEEITFEELILAVIDEELEELELEELILAGKTIRLAE